MKPSFLLPVAVASLVFATTLTDAVARDRYGDGCRGSDLSCSDLNYYCSLGSQTPVSVRPFCDDDRRGRRHRDRDRGDDYEGSSRRLSYDELRYYCSLGNQTPRSMRDKCRREGL